VNQNLRDISMIILASLLPQIFCTSTILTYSFTLTSCAIIIHCLLHLIVLFFFSSISSYSFLTLLLYSSLLQLRSIILSSFPFASSDRTLIQPLAIIWFFSLLTALLVYASILLFCCHFA